MVSKKKAFIMMGAPGSGKGTQGELLEKNLGIKRYVMSDLIRASLKEGSELYEKINNGKLLDDIDIFKIFREGFKGDEKIIIDGIPRTLDQAYWLCGVLSSQDYDVYVLYLECDQEKLVQRILLRGRKDDKEDVFRHRLDLFNKANDAVREVFDKSIITFDGDREIEVIQKDILGKLKEMNLN